MNLYSKTPDSQTPDSKTPDVKTPDVKGPDVISQNIDSIAAFYKREHEKVTAQQRVVERISQLAAQPLFLSATLLVIALWILVNVGLQLFNQDPFDPQPYQSLQGVITLQALLTTTAVLIRQERLAKIDELRDHLDLQLNLLTEQKTTKLINLIEELRFDLPMVRNRQDVQSEAMQQATDPQRVLNEIDIALLPSHGAAGAALNPPGDLAG